MRTRRFPYVCRWVIVIVIIAIATVLILLYSQQKKTLAMSLKEADQVDVYLFAKGKERYVGSSELYNQDLGASFGTNSSPFGDSITIDEEYKERLTYEGGILLKFRFPKAIQKIDVYCHEISDPLILDDAARSACFDDSKNGLLFLVETNGCFFEIEDPAFFSDIVEFFSLV